MSTTRAPLPTPVNPLLGAQIDALGLQRETQQLVTGSGFFCVAEVAMFSNEHGRSIFHAAWSEMETRLHDHGITPGLLPWCHNWSRSIHGVIVNEGVLANINSAFDHLGHCVPYCGPSLLAVALHPDLGLGERDVAYLRRHLGPYGLSCGRTIEQLRFPEPEHNPNFEAARVAK